LFILVFLDFVLFPPFVCFDFSTFACVCLSSFLFVFVPSSVYFDTSPPLRWFLVCLPDRPVETLVPGDDWQRYWPRPLSVTPPRVFETPQHRLILAVSPFIPISRQQIVPPV
jgi:hypothetical protein